LALLAIVVLFGSGYGAVVLNWAMGPWEATGIEQDGSLTHMRFDPAMPPADFVPLFPGAQVIQSTRVMTKDAPSGVGMLDLSVHGSADAVRDFYRAPPGSDRVHGQRTGGAEPEPGNRRLSWR